MSKAPQFTPALSYVRAQVGTIDSEYHRQRGVCCHKVAMTTPKWKYGGVRHIYPTVQRLSSCRHVASQYRESKAPVLFSLAVPLGSARGVGVGAGERHAFLLLLLLYPIYRAKMVIYVTRSKDRWEIRVGAFPPSVTDPFLQSLWLGVVGIWGHGMLSEHSDLFVEHGVNLLREHGTPVYGAWGTSS